MFAYCNNNPVNMVDPNGCFAWIIPLIIFIPLLLSGCSADSSSSPSDYKTNNDKIGACYEYVGTYIGWTYSTGGDTDPGTYYERIYGNGVSKLPEIFSITEVSQLFEKDLIARSVEYSRYDSFSQIPKLENNQKLIACMQYTTKKGYCDYHFAVMLSNGEWADKYGVSKSRYGVLTFDGMTWTDGKNISTSAENSCFFVITVGK